MKFLADESCDFNVVRTLRAAGHDVLAICEFAKRMDDAEVISLSGSEKRVLITEDKVFGRLVYAHGHFSRGVILIRYPTAARRGLSADILRLAEQKKDALQDSFAVLEPGRSRVTHPPQRSPE